MRRRKQKPQRQSRKLPSLADKLSGQHKLPKAEYRSGARRPIVRNKDGVVVWEVGPDRYYYRNEKTGKLRRCSWSITETVIVVRDAEGEIVEAYKLKAGDTVETTLEHKRAMFYEQPLLELYIDPGNASVETIQAVLQGLSDLHFASGGLGLEFVNDGNFIYTSEKITI